AVANKRREGRPHTPCAVNSATECAAYLAMRRIPHALVRPTLLCGKFRTRSVQPTFALVRHALSKGKWSKPSLHPLQEIRRMLSHLRDVTLFLALCGFIGTAGKAPAAETWPVPRGPAREPMPYRYDAKVWQTVPREF